MLVVDDVSEVRQLIADTAELEGHDVLEASNGLGAIEACEAKAPDIVLLDLRLPDIHGLKVCVELRRFFQGPIVVLSGCDEEETVARALDLGADDYLVKPFKVKELLARLRAVARRTVGISPVQSVEAGPFRMDFERHRFYVQDREVSLTPTEFNLFEYLLTHRDRVVTTEELLGKIWGSRHRGYVQTLRVHIGHLRDKIEQDRKEPRYLLTVPRIGFMLSAGTVGAGARVGLHAAEALHANYR